MSKNKESKTKTDKRRNHLERLQRISFRVGHITIPLINVVAAALMILSVGASIACLVALVIRTGFDHSPSSVRDLHVIIRICQWIFISTVVFNLVFKFRNTCRQTRIVKWIIDVALLTTLLPLVYPRPLHPWIPWLSNLLYSTTYHYVILAVYSIVTISYAMLKMVGRRTNPSLLMSVSFIVFIAIGTLLLMLPKSTYNGISFFDALFVSTSAVSITGLTPIDVPTTFTPMGTLILAILIQIGALGVMTFTSFFAIFFSGSTSIYSQLMLKDMIYSKNMSSLIPTLLYILFFTLTIEAIGTVLIFLSIHGTLGMTGMQELYFSAFHSLSAFCNAGFSTLPDGLSNPMLLDHNISIYWVMSLMIIAGSIGFPILVNFRDALCSCIASFFRHFHRSKRKADPIRSLHIFNMNTKIVLATFAILFFAGAILFFILERDNTLAHMSLWQQITQSVFNSATPRSAGFSSVNPADFLSPTLIIIMALMWVGGASQSTGGGIKVNTLAAIWLNIRSIITGSDNVVAFRRTINLGSIRRANAVVALSIISYLLVSLILLVLEPDLPVRQLLFESCSALFTVGSSLGATSHLGDASKLLLSIAMFVGRVGLLSLLIGLSRHALPNAPKFPTDNIIIN
ncbi:MAG: potassium transporter [Bacteroides sp.]|nr:potassium transporter [Bacteroides sp.]MCM1412733.1 potassium transporter [Bacteroides sp.]MCM1470973.1 potassium transporter [Bacteroides sp.]